MLLSNYKNASLIKVLCIKQGKNNKHASRFSHEACGFHDILSRASAVKTQTCGFSDSVMEQNVPGFETLCFQKLKIELFDIFKHRFPYPGYHRGDDKDIVVN